LEIKRCLSSDTYKTHNYTLCAERRTFEDEIQQYVTQPLGSKGVQLACTLKSNERFHCHSCQWNV